MATIREYETAKGKRFEVGYTMPDGGRTRKRGFRTKRDAKVWSAANLIAMSKPNYRTQSDLSQKLGPFIDEFLARRATLAATTVANRAAVAGKWITPYWSETSLEALTKKSVRAWVESIHAAGAGAQTIQKAHQILGGVLEECVEQGLLTGNPARGVKLPTVVTREHGYLSAPQVAHLLDEAQERDRMLIAFLAFSGLRFGEAAALTFADLDFANNVVHVRRSATEVRGELVLGPPKNGKARQVPGVPQVMEPLRRRSAGREAHDLVFTGPGGRHAQALDLAASSLRSSRPACDRKLANEQLRARSGRAALPEAHPARPAAHRREPRGFRGRHRAPRAGHARSRQAEHHARCLHRTLPGRLRPASHQARRPRLWSGHRGPALTALSPFILRAECRPVRFVDRPAFGFHACFQ